MSEEPKPITPTEAEFTGIKPTEMSKELTDKIHRLVRRFSRELVQLVSEEIGARAVKVKMKPGPRPGHKARKQLCPLCRIKVNAFRRFGFICRDCRGQKKVSPKQKVSETIHPAHEVKNKDRLGQHFKVKVPIPQHLPVTPRETIVEDVEPDFVDTLVQIVEVSPPVKPKPVEKPTASDDADDMEFFS